MAGKHIVLSGFMATGKTSLAPIVAERAGLDWVDIDATVERRANATVAEVWRREGERAFRQREKEILREALAGPPKVIACGGGTLLDRTARHEALDRATVVTLTAPPEVCVARAGDLSSRPNLAGPDALARAKELLAARADAYAEAHGVLSTDDVDHESVADAVLAIVARAPIAVPLGVRSYAIDVVHDRPLAITDAVAALGPSTLVVVTDAHVFRSQHRRLEAAMHPLPMSGNLITLSPGESNKTIAAAMTIWDGALGAGVDRDSVVLAFGGGVVGDLAGFAAATLLRGIRFVQAPTTLLAMVDASVGGKTGFDHATALLQRRPESLSPVVRRAIELKARIVRDDETEQGARALLNLGHTFGHALEAATAFREVLHGEAVAAGLVAELEWTTARGWTEAGLAERTKRLLSLLGLTVDVSRARWAAAKRFVRADKKRSAARLRLPVVRELGVATLETVDAAALEAALG